MRKTARVLALVLAALLLGSATAAYVAPSARAEAAAAGRAAAGGEVEGGQAAGGGWQPTEDDAGWQRFRQVMQILQETYVDVPDMKKVWDGALRGAVEALGDKYSVYLEPRQYEQFRERVLEGTFGGVGIVIELVGSYITVVSTLPGTPAERAGLQPGDRIVRVDGQDVVGWLVEAAGQKIRGEPGTKVILSVERGASSAPFEVELVREEVRIRPLDARVLDGQIAYLRLSSFELGVGKNFAAVMAGYRRQGIRKYILDLRGNAGGLLSEALQVAQEFLPRGTLVRIVQRDGNTTAIGSRSAPWEYSLVVLVDGGTASAAEIVAGAIADRGYGMLIGSRTFGKGSVQTVIPFADGAALKVTTARFLTPLGHVIDGKGIEPRVTVAPPPRGERVEPFVWKRDLALGTVGLDVLSWQENLAYLGLYGGKLDGIFGRETAAATRRFQAGYRATSGAMPGATSGATPATPGGMPATSRDGDSGMPVLAVTGRVDAATASAMAEQVRQHLIQDKPADPALEKALEVLGANPLPEAASRAG